MLKKALSFLLSLVMLAACACPAAALAEEESSGWFSGLMDGAKNAAEKGLSGLMKLLGGLMGEKEPLPAEEEEEYAEEEARSDIAEFFDCTFWEGDGRTMAIAYQDGAFRITVQDGEIPLSYLCEAEEVAEGDSGFYRFTSLGAEGEQPGHGKAVFQTEFWSQEITWQRDGESIVFSRLSDPLDNSEWLGAGKKLWISWKGGQNYELIIEQNYFTAWRYTCVLNQETNALEGVGEKERGEDRYTGSNAAFAFNEARTRLTWTDEKEPEAAAGLTFDMIPYSLMTLPWHSEHYAMFMAMPDSFGRYDIHVWAEELADAWDGEEDGAEEAEATEEPEDTRDGNAEEAERIEYDYLCTFDWDTRTFTAMDPAAIDFDAMETYRDKTLYVSTATFTWIDDAHIVWQDASGLSGDGVVLANDLF